MSEKRTKATETRSIVLEILMEAMPERNGANIKGNLLIRDVLDKYDYMDTRDKAFIKCLAEGCLEQQICLDYLIEHYAKTKNGRIKPVVRNILRMGIYQILEMDSVPDSAACNESVKLAVQKGLGGLKGFVNGVLRTITREKENLPWPEKTEGIRYWSVRYSVPEWIIKKWQSCYEEQTLEKMLTAINKPSAICVHFREDRLKSNGQNAELERWQQEMQAAGYILTPHPYLKYAFYLDKKDGMDRISNAPGFDDGRFYVQDVSSMLAVEALGMDQMNLQQGIILDVCAAPGGKSLHCALKLGNQGMVYSRDLYEDKTSLIEENVNRLHLNNVKVEEWDALHRDEAMLQKADVVIADLPCSGLGIMGRKGDIRYHITKEQVNELAALQKRILTVVKDYVKPGGYLLYSTCTISRQENEENRDYLLSLGEFEPVDFSANMPGELQTESTKAGYLQLLPGVHPSDGFFFSAYRRVRPSV